MSEQEPETELLRCKDCGAEFPLTPSEQRWFREREMHQPKRCRSCRQARHNRRAAEQRPTRERAE